MQIVIPATLTAKYTTYDPDDFEDKSPKVRVQFGDYTVVILPAVREATDYYSRDEEEEEITQETVANWLKEKLG